MAGAEDSSKTSSTLLERIAQGDPRSWDIFHRFYEPYVRAYITACLKKRNLDHLARERDDIEGDIWRKLVVEMPRFELNRARGGFRKWLWTVTHNVVMDAARKQKRAPEPLPPEPVPQPPPELPPGTLPEPVLELLEIARRETQASNKWACFEGRFLHGKSGNQVAAELGLTVNQVHVYASRVLARIRELARDLDVDF